MTRTSPLSWWVGIGFGSAATGVTLQSMIWEILLLLTVYVLTHVGEVWMIAFGFGLGCVVVHLNANENTPNALSLKQALWRVFKLTKALYRRIVVSAFVFVNSAGMLLVGLWKEWLVLMTVAVSVMALWRSLRPQQPTA